MTQVPPSSGQEIYLMFILEYNPCQAVLALYSYPETLPQKLTFGVFIRVTLICSLE